MAIVQAHGLGAQSTVRGPVYWNVYVKRAWSDDWTFIPYLAVLSVEECTAPSVGVARLRYHYGLIKREDMNVFSGFYPLNISGCYIGIEVVDSGGAAPLWFGVCDWERHEPHGSLDYFQGPQDFNCYELLHLLDRVTVAGTWTEHGAIDRGVRFNVPDSRGLITRGNRSASVGPDGVYVFGDSNNKWTSLTQIEYLIDYYAPNGLTFYIGGDYSSLDLIKETWDVQGKSLKQNLDQLIDQKRGMSYRLLTTGSGAICVYIFSCLADPVSVGNVTVPANSNQVIANFDGRIDMQPTITLNRLATFDAVEVRGGPICTCFSLSFYDGTLQAGWTAGEEAAYVTGGTSTDSTAKDAERETDKYRQVYALFRIPDNWNGLVGDGIGGTKYNALIGYDQYGNWQIGNVANLYARDKSFSYETCIQSPYDDDGQPVYYPMRVIAQDPTDNSWHLVDKFDVVGYSPAQVRPSKRGCGIYVTTRPNHLKALNTFTDPNTDKDPEWDFATMIATVMLETDAHPTVYVSLGNGQETARTKVIEYPGAEVWIILPGTVTDVTNAALVHDAGTVMRDDTDTLRMIAALAAAWYLTPRCELNWVYSGVGIAYPCGTLVRGMASNWTLTAVNSVVTKRTWDRTGGVPTTTYETGWSELNFAETAGTKAGMKGQGVSRRNLPK